MMAAEYDEGQQAYYDGLTDADNPYPVGSDEAMDWYDGWASNAEDGDWDED